VPPNRNEQSAKSSKTHQLIGGKRPKTSTGHNNKAVSWQPHSKKKETKNRLLTITAQLIAVDTRKVPAFKNLTALKCC
jgi:hypothetical protein